MPKITIYSTSTCPYCRAEKKYLDSRGVKYEDIVLDQHPEAVQTSVDTCKSNAVPCTHIVGDDGNSVEIVGFDQPKLDAALGL